MPLTVAQLVALAACVVAVATFVSAAGLFFRRPGATRREDPIGLNLVKLVGPLAYLAMIYAVASAQAPAPRALGGAGLFLLATALFLWAVATNRRRPLTRIFSPDTPEHLVTAGPYRLVRHPCYSAYLLSFAAALVVNPTPWLFGVSGLILALFVLAARQEERKFDSSPLAQEYARYRKRTGMLLPRPPGRSRDAEG